MIFNTTTNYAISWKAEEKEKYIDLQLSTHEKNEDGSYRNSRWLARAVGNAAKTLRGIQKGDRITFTKSKITHENYKNDKGEWADAPTRLILLEATIDKKKTATDNQEVKEPQQKAAQENNSEEPW